MCTAINKEVVILSDSDSENNDTECNIEHNDAPMSQKQQLESAEHQLLTNYLPDDDTDDSDEEEELLLQRVKQNVLQQNLGEKINEIRKRSMCEDNQENETEVDGEMLFAPFVAKRRTTLDLCESKDINYEDFCCESMITINANNFQEEPQYHCSLSLELRVADSTNTYSIDRTSVDHKRTHYFNTKNTHKHVTHKYHNKDALYDSKHTTNSFNFGEMKKALDQIHDDLFLMEVDPYPVVHLRRKRRFSELGFEEEDFNNKIFQESRKKRKKVTDRKNTVLVGVAKSKKHSVLKAICRRF